MKSYQACWEDEENNRKIAVRVDYTVGQDSVRISAVTPEEVTFLCPQTKACLRTIQVWTETGRSLLARQFRASTQFVEIQQELATRYSLAFVG